MKVAQLRTVLDTIARHRQTLGRKQEAEALAKLAEALRPTDKLTVAKAVEKLRAP
jgi:hypothetical protein